jgi:ribosome-associated protein
VKEQKKPLAGRLLIECAAQSAFDKKAERMVCIDIRSLTGFADWFCVCQGDNPAHNRAIAESVLEALEREATVPWHVEGLEQGRWILIDYSDVVIHIMLPELRKYYLLEQLWPSCPCSEIADEHESVKDLESDGKPAGG